MSDRAAASTRRSGPGPEGEPWFVAPRRPPAGVPRSAVHGGRRFSTRSDYEAHLIERGWASAAEGVWDDVELVAGIQRDWHAQGQTGCLFARSLARTLSHRAWPSATIPCGRPTGAAVDAAIAAAIADADAQVLSVLFPAVDEPRALGRLLADFARSSRLLRAAPASTHRGLTVLRLRAPVTGDGVLAWILAFGPFAFWPATRRGPALELVIRVKAKAPRVFARVDQDRRTAHLADTPIAMADEAAERMWQGTRRAAQRILGEHGSVLTSADVTLSIPAELGSQPGSCWPPAPRSPA